MAKKTFETNITLRYWGADLSQESRDSRLAHVYEQIERGYTSGHGLEFYWETKDSAEVQVIIPESLLKEIKTALELYADPENWKPAKTGGIHWEGGTAPGFLSRKLIAKMGQAGF